MSETPSLLRVAVHHGAGAAMADKAERPALLEELAAEARHAGAHLLLLPQLFASGRPRSAAEAQRLAELSDGPGARKLTAIAKAHELALACGYVELCTGHLFDATLFVDEQGRAIANYRRIHMEPEVDGGLFAPGQWLTLVPFRGRRLGLLAGIDIDGPEQARALALASASVLLAAGDHGPASPVGVVLPARAAENGCALAFANACAEPGSPPSCLIGPDGRTLAATASGLAVAELPMLLPEQVTARHLVRRPRLYQRLVAPLPEEDAPRL